MTEAVLSYRNQSIDLRSKSMDWFLHDNGFRHERVNMHYLIDPAVLLIYLSIYISSIFAIV